MESFRVAAVSRKALGGKSTHSIQYKPDPCRKLAEVSPNNPQEAAAQSRYSSAIQWQLIQTTVFTATSSVWTSKRQVSGSEAVVPVLIPQQGSSSRCPSVTCKLEKCSHQETFLQMPIVALLQITKETRAPAASRMPAGGRRLKHNSHSSESKGGTATKQPRGMLAM